jgi:hypothetical protein
MRSLCRLNKFRLTSSTMIEKLSRHLICENKYDIFGDYYEN